MTFLELCQRLRQEAGIAGSGPATVINQQGEAQRIVSWVQQAYQDIQEKNPNWIFLRQPFTLTLAPGVAVYDKSNSAFASLDGFRQEKRLVVGLPPSTTVNRLVWLDYDWLDEHCLTGSSKDAIGVPTQAAVNPMDNSLVLWPTPDQAYVVRGELFRTPHVLLADTDTPIFDKYQMAIVWKALCLYGAYSAEPAVFSHAQQQLERLYDKMEYTYLPRLRLGSHAPWP